MTDSFRLGTSTSGVEVTHISAQGVWVLSGEKELFLAYDQFPWFKDSPVAAILNVQESSPGRFYWPDLDIDLTVEIIEYPERFPLTAKTKRS